MSIESGSAGVVEPLSIVLSPSVDTSGIRKTLKPGKAKSPLNPPELPADCGPQRIRPPS
ncbi:hypothetical protein [Caballeronia sordidicola]|uniref:hypothetical protein n=1 Tax=Caballeronia sordidicola TaxID=196367 RepID=UPI001363115A|nr:hypothetical protein [Caballeronia sordidicola]